MAKKKSEPTETPTPPLAPYTVVARRYRPQQFEQLIGQEAPAQALINALTNGRVAHAYLFTGARGVGKTSTARILAKALNCVKGPTPHPCDACDMCLGIASGEDVDVIEIDGASNRGIDEVRELRANVQFRPSRGRHKIYIIDEVHMLTTPAFNALLKTLEEPPAGVKFIFATTEVSKIPITILSRCQRFDFGTIRTDRIAEHLRSIVRQEEKEADDLAVEMIARRAAGSMRDGESLLDQLLSFGERVTPELVNRLLGTAAADRVAGIVEAIVAKDAGRAIGQLHAAMAEGVQPGELIDQLVEFWRDLMLMGSCGPAFPGIANPPAVVQKVAGQLSIDMILAGLDVLATTKSRLKFTSFGPMLLEMAVVRLARLDSLFSVGDLWAMVEGGPTSPRPMSPTVQVPETRPTLGAMAEKKKMTPSSSARP